MSLTTHQHEILTMLRTMELTDAQRLALSELLALAVTSPPAVEVVDPTSDAALAGRLAVVERGIDHLTTLIVCGPDGERTEPLMPTPNTISAVMLVHMEWMRCILHGEHPKDFDATAADLTERHYNDSSVREVVDSVQRMAAAVGAKRPTTCNNPTCRIHQQWWSAN